MKGKLKRGLLILLTLVMVLSCLTVPALADEDVGDPNISGDDGGTGAGSESAYWGLISRECVYLCMILKENAYEQQLITRT